MTPVKPKKKLAFLFLYQSVFIMYISAFTQLSEYFSAPTFTQYIFYLICPVPCREKLWPWTESETRSSGFVRTQSRCVCKASKRIVSTAFRLWAMTHHRKPKVPDSVVKLSFSDWRKVLTISCVSLNAPGPPFPPESFDRVLLDAPCSSLGQRPNMSCTWTLKEICSYPPLQRKLFRAVGFLFGTDETLPLIFCFTTITLTGSVSFQPVGGRIGQAAWSKQSFNTHHILQLVTQFSFLGELYTCWDDFVVLRKKKCSFGPSLIGYNER